ncbi:TetR/AcrR family transcriptional regulator [Gordonia sp. (in: high G+C Gram-positive bacteria)]|uniref:TetR/AcrR family transcriptional regulator n=1 Tax=Gordonia sp. (in: high G+C Gram-positive bacteria) TaxID=84139 RepID=UPI003C7245BA
MTADTGRRRPYAPRMDPAARRESLLDAALAVIVADGVHKVSIETVAAAAGVTRPVVYKHFDDSAALLRASLRREEGRALAQLSEALDVGDGGDRGRALAVYDNLLAMFESSPDLWRAVLVLADSATPQFRDRLDAGGELAAGRIEQLLVEHSPGSAALDGAVVARMIVALVKESGKLLLGKPDEYPRARLVAAAEAVLGRFSS